MTQQHSTDLQPDFTDLAELAQAIANTMADEVPESPSAARVISLANVINREATRLEELAGSIRTPPSSDSERALHARVAALGYELFQDADGRQVVLEYRPSTQHVEGYFEAVFIHRDEGDDRLEDWLERREAYARDCAELGYDPDSPERLNAEIAEAYPNATAFERKMLRAIRPNISMTPDEERQLLNALVAEVRSIWGDAVDIGELATAIAETAEDVEREPQGRIITLANAIKAAAGRIEQQYEEAGSRGESPATTKPEQSAD